MELLCTVYPVTDLEAAARFYLDLGFRDVARPDKETILLATNDSPYVEIMLENHPAEHGTRSGPVFRIEDVEKFFQSKPDFDWIFRPVEIVTGMYAAFRDADGNPIRVADFRNDSGRYARLFRPRD
jgi:catechol 2,3-dioxygenase-like lactoylglutathione lyase family enzyme